MTYLFYSKESITGSSHSISLDARYTHRFWTPSILRIVPKGLSLLPFGVWWLFHHLHIFSNRDYGLFLVYSDGQLVHRTCVFPGYFRFPFMGKDDLQIGDTSTSEGHRGKGIAPFAIEEVVAMKSRPGRRFWYITSSTNAASIRAAEKAGFTLMGKGFKTKRFGLRILGAYVLESDSTLKP